MLLWHLNQFQWIELPGIGYFTADIIKARINENGTISPSQIKLHFESLAHQKIASLVENIVDETGFSKERIEQSIDELVHHLGTELRVRKTVEFEPFGKLFYSEPNHVLQFVPTNKNIHQEFFYQEDLPLVAINQKNKSDFIPKPVSDFKAPIKNKSAVSPYLLYLLAFLWLLFISLLLCPAKKNQNLLSNNHISNKQDSLSSLDSNKINHLINSTLSKEKIDSTSNTLQNKNSNLNNKQKIDSSLSSMKEKDTHLTKEEKIESNNINTLNEQIKNKKCVIIVGSFKIKSNAKKQIKKVKLAKYKSYTEMFGDFQRVGVEFDCAHQNLETMLAKLKKRFTTDAWILKY